MKMKSNLMGLIAAAALLVGGSATYAGVMTDSPELPPNDGVYRTAEDVHAEFTGGDLEIVLEDVLHKPIALEIPGYPERRQEGADEVETFLTELTATSVATSPTFELDGDVDTIELTGQMTVRSIGKWGQTTGTFDTEIVSLQLSGVSLGGIPLVINSGSDFGLPSTGQTTITDFGGGQFLIDSFFDITSEIVLDPTGVVPLPPELGGGFLGPFPLSQVAGPTHVDLVPEPSTLALAAFGALSFLGIGRRRGRVA